MRDTGMRNRGGLARLAWVTLLGLLVLGGVGCGSTVPDEVSEEPPSSPPPPVCTPGVDACPVSTGWLWYPEIPTPCTSEQVGTAGVLGLAMDGAGNSLVVGSILGTFRFGSTSLTGSRSGLDLFVAKVDAAGVPVWGKLLKVGGLRGPPPLIGVDRGGNVLVAGEFTESLGVDDVTLAAGSGATPFVLKLSPSGALLWAQRVVPLVGQSSVFGGLAVDPSGNVAVTGTFKGTLRIGSEEHTASSANAFYVAKLAASTGEPLWSRSLEHTTWLGTVDAALDEAGDVLLVGSFGSKEGSEPFVFDGTVLTTTDVTADVFVAKLEGGTGRARWVQKVVVAPSVGPLVPSVNVDSTGNAWVVIGTLPASLVLTKLDGAGQLLASSRLAAGGAQSLIQHIPRTWRVAFDTSGNMVVAGQGRGPVDLGGGVRTLDNSAFVAWYDANGGYVTDRIFGASGGGGVAVDASGNVVVGGTLSGSVDLGSGPVTPCGLSPFLLKFDPTP